MLKITGLNLTYQQHRILKDINLQFDIGLHTIIGKSGSGKTSLLRCIAGLERYTGSITGYDPKQIGYLEQHLTLFPQSTIAENIAFPLQVRHYSKTEIAQQLKQLLHNCQLTHLAERYPHQLSGGEQRRAMLARSLIYHPQLLLCDEPFSALDSITRVELVRWFKQLIIQQQMVVLYVSHDLTEASYLSQTVTILEIGSVVAQGSWNELSHPLLDSHF